MYFERDDNSQWIQFSNCLSIFREQHEAQTRFCAGGSMLLLLFGSLIQFLQTVCWIFVFLHNERTMFFTTKNNQFHYLQQIVSTDRCDVSRTGHKSAQTGVRDRNV